jgi:hypothetical protein
MIRRSPGTGNICVVTLVKVSNNPGNKGVVLLVPCQENHFGVMAKTVWRVLGMGPDGLVTGRRLASQKFELRAPVLTNASRRDATWMI